MRRLVVLVLVTACSGSSPPKAPATTATAPAPMTATPASSEDVVVARVNDQPVYGSCVQAQAARGASKDVALQQCIDFELLAQRAAAFATDAEVIGETKRALVSQFIAHEYEDRYNDPKDFGPAWNKFLDINKTKLEHGEARGSAYARIPVPKKATPEQDATAKAIAEELAARFATERGLTPAHLKDIATQIVAGRAKLESEVVPAYLNNGGLVKPYADALFAIPEVGRTSPAVRTDWGWDVVLLNELIPAEKLSPAEVVEKILPELKRSYFTTWARQAAKGVTVQLFDDNVGKLEDL